MKRELSKNWQKKKWRSRLPSGLTSQKLTVPYFIYLRKSSPTCWIISSKKISAEIIIICVIRVPKKKLKYGIVKSRVNTAQSLQPFIVLLRTASRDGQRLPVFTLRHLAQVNNLSDMVGVMGQLSLYSIQHAQWLVPDINGAM